MASRSLRGCRPPPSTAGPPESPCRNVPRSVVTARLTGPRPYASVISTNVVTPIRAAEASKGPSSG